MLLVASVGLLLLLRPLLVDLTSSGAFPWLLVALVVSVFTNVAANGVYGTGKVGINQIGSLIDTLVRITIQVIAVILGYGIAGLAGGLSPGSSPAVSSPSVPGPLACTVRAAASATSSPSRSGRSRNSSGYLVFSYADTIAISYFMTDVDEIYRVALN